MFAVGQGVIHPSFGIGVVKAEDDKTIRVKFMDGLKTLVKKLPVAMLLRPATELEQKQADLKTFFDTHTHSAQLKTYIQWLREAGPNGVANDCGCVKNQFYNYTCECRTLVKLYHRFSIFKDELSKRGYHITDVEMENGKHKTILHAEPLGAPCQSIHSSISSRN